MYVTIDRDEKVALDPITGVIAELDENVIVADLGVLHNRIDQLEKLSAELFNSLDPRTAPYVSYPNREGIFLKQGLIANFIYGLLVGLIIVTLVIALVVGL
ncbi:MAG: tetrahydromethanopterin S-methyltransferase subunit MtrB [Methanosarcinales archaeon]